MTSIDYSVKLPDTRDLAKLRHIGLSYRTISHFYSVSARIVRPRFEKRGSQNKDRGSVYRSSFWQKASTALALIRYGFVTYEALRQGLGYRSRSSTYYFIDKLIALGWVTKTPGKAATIRLTVQGEKMGTLIVPVQQQPNGDLEVCRYRPVNSKDEPGERKNGLVGQERGTSC